MRCLVSGRVQGVFFRASARERALRLGISGWVRNLPDGRVEVQAEGTPEQLEAFERWLWRGPEHAEVTGVVREPCPLQSHTGFAVR